MKKTTVIVIVSALLIVGFAFGTQAKIRMLNGDDFVCEVKTEQFNFITDFSEISFTPEMLQEVYFTSPETQLTEIRTVYKNEKYTGLLANKTVTIIAMGNELVLLKDKIDRITFNTANKNIFDYQAKISLRTGDLFYGVLSVPDLKIKTSYGIFKLKPDEISKITFEGAGKVTSTVEMKSGNTVKGIIRNDYLPITLLGEQNIQIVPDKISTIIIN